MATNPTAIFGHEDACLCPCCCVSTLTDENVAAGDGSGGGSKPVFTSAQVIDQLTKSWSTSGYDLAWDKGTVTYTMSYLPADPGGGEAAGWKAMTAVMQNAAREAMELWDDVIAIDITEVANNASADISLNYSSTTGGGTYAKTAGFFGGSRADAYFTDVDIWFADNWWTHNDDNDFYGGGYGIMTYVHEIGHALGLSHPGHYNGSADFASDADYHQDTRQYTTMSYFNAGESGESVDHIGANGYSTRYASTPLLHDILALQSLYGADMTTRTGNTTYGFNSNAGRSAFDFNTNVDPIVAIWDAGGIDTIDVSGWSTNQTVDLTAGAFSSVASMSKNLAIAHGATIENAIGGGGADTLLGNAVANRLEGGAGADTLRGGAGGDTLVGGLGVDTLEGGSGGDTFYFGASDDGATVLDFDSEDRLGFSSDALAAAAFATAVQVGADTRFTHNGSLITLENISKSALSRIADSIRLGGSGSNDDGGATTGFSDGDFSDATFAVWVDLDYAGESGIEAWTQDDADATDSNGAWRALINLESVATVLGTAFDDLIRDDAANNTVTAAAGDDSIYLSDGFDAVDGGTGTDRVDFSEYQTAIWVDLSYAGFTGYEAWTRGGTDVASGDWRAVGDLTGVENVTGTAHDDLFYGDAGNNAFSGGKGADRFVIEAGLDHLDGGSGIDTADFSGFESAVWIDLAYTGPTGFEAWTRGNETVTSGTWQAIADIQAVESLVGSAFDDVFFDTTGNETLAGGAGDDAFFLRGGFDEVAGDAGTDTVDFSAYTSAVWIDLAYTGPSGFEGWTRDNETLASGKWRAIADIESVESLVGSAFADAFLDTTGNETLAGGAGDDAFFLRGGFDEVSGDAGSDTIDFSAYTSAVWIDLSYTGPSGFEGWTRGNETVTSGEWRAIAEVDSVENIVGTGFHDDLRGDSQNNRFEGGAGNDRFVFKAGFGTDTIADFQDTGSGYEDALDFSLNDRVNGMADILSIATVGTDMHITTGDGTVILAGVTTGIDSDDFNF